MPLNVGAQVTYHQPPVLILSVFDLTLRPFHFLWTSFTDDHCVNSTCPVYVMVSRNLLFVDETVHIAVLFGVLDQKACDSI